MRHVGKAPSGKPAPRAQGYPLWVFLVFVLLVFISNTVFWLVHEHKRVAAMDRRMFELEQLSGNMTAVNAREFVRRVVEGAASQALVGTKSTANSPPPPGRGGDGEGQGGGGQEKLREEVRKVADERKRAEEEAARLAAEQEAVRLAKNVTEEARQRALEEAGRRTAEMVAKRAEVERLKANSSASAQAQVRVAPPPPVTVQPQLPPGGKWDRTDTHRTDTHMVVYKGLPVQRDVGLVLTGRADMAAKGREWVRQTREAWKTVVQGEGGKVWSEDVKKPGNIPPIKGIELWGERNSCTTLIMSMILQNFKVELCPRKHDDCVRGGLAWKHGFMRDSNPVRDKTWGAGELNLLITREPYAWLESMSRNAHYAHVHNYVSTVWGLEDFLSLEWATFGLESIPAIQPIKPAAAPASSSQIYRMDYNNETYEEMFRSVRTTPNLWPVTRKPKGELLIERDPDAKRRFPGIAAMRTAKLRDWVRFAHRFDRAGHIMCEDFMRDPEAVLNHLESFYNLTRIGKEWNLNSCTSNYGSCEAQPKTGKSDPLQGWNSTKIRGKREYYTAGKYFDRYTDETIGLANAFLDPDLEGLFGYSIIGSKAEIPKVLAPRARHPHGWVPKLWDR